MGFFNKQRTDGATFDGQGEERKGFIDIVQYNGESDDLLWRFPYDNLSTNTRLIVQEGQEAIFVSGGKMADVFGPGTHTLKSNNIPILQKIVNLPFGGESPFKATVYYVNTTTRVNQWGTMGMFPVRDPYFGVTVKIGAYGNCGIRVVDSAAFIREFTGTLHSMSASEFQEKFREQISQYIKPCISKYFSQQQASITEINNYLLEIARFVQGELNGFFEKYGLQLADFAIGGINADEDDPNYRQILEAQTSGAAMDFESAALARKRAREGYTYQQERQFDVMEGAASNEGSAGTMMGAGMGIGMGLGVGGTLGAQMGQMAGVMGSQPVNGQTAPQGGAAVPPPPPSMASYHVLVNNQQLGPFDMSRLAQMVQSGELIPQTYVWKQGMDNWAAASACPELASLFGAVPPPPPVNPYP